jgi:hypothetical protein
MSGMGGISRTLKIEMVHRMGISLHYRLYG